MGAPCSIMRVIFQLITEPIQFGIRRHMLQQTDCTLLGTLIDIRVH